MALTNEEKQELLNAIKAESQSVDELEVVSSLDNVNSLPAMRGEEVVLAPISLLGAPAVQAAQSANAAATAANNAAGTANAKAQEANAAAGAANDAAARAEAAADGAVVVGGAGEKSVTQDGCNNSVTGSRSVAFGTGNTVSGTNSVAIGEDNTVTSHESAAFGDSNTVEGNNSLAEGHYTHAAGSSSHAEGKRTTATGSYSHAEGLGTTAGALSGSHAQGRYNVGNDDSIDEVGIGDEDNHRNAEETKSDGKKYIIGVGGYDGTNAGQDGVQSVQEVLEGSGSGGNTINVTETYPLASGYYTLATAIAAVESKRRALGRCVTYEKSQGKWETKQFSGTSLSTWEQEASWEDFGGGGTIKSLTVNGERKTPDPEGNISITVDEVEIDESLNTDSTNPVQNKTVAAKLNEVEASTVFGMTAELSDDETSVRLALTNKSNAEIAYVDIPAGSGGGGGGGDASTTKIVLTADTDKKTIKTGDSLMLTYTYDHQYSSGDDRGESTGQKATINVQVKYGSTTTYNLTLKEVTKGTYTLDLTKFLFVGVSDIYVIATTTDPSTGRTQRKQSYVSVKSVALSLGSSYNLANTIQGGGYGAYDTATIPYAVTGSGTKTVMLYLDGVQRLSEPVTRSGTVRGEFSLPMSGLSVGRHTVQMVAEMETDGLTLRSESIHIDLLKAGSNAPFIGTMQTHADGYILDRSSHLNPTISVGQYEKMSFAWVAYDPDNTPASVEIWKNGSKSSTVSAPRTTMTYSNRFTEQGSQSLMLKLGATSYPIGINVTDSGIDIGEATFGLALKLDAAGRSNDESNRAEWSSGDVRTTFEGFDWSSSGWTGEALKLTNGARAVIGYKPFATDVKATGLTIEMTLRVSNSTDSSAIVISCMDSGKGLSITTSEASFKTGTTVRYTNEDDEEVERDVQLGTNYVQDEWIKVALVIGTRAENRLMELYINGNRTGADIYDNNFSFMQDNPQDITIDSSAADVEIKSVRVYNRRLIDDEELENRMVDCTDGDEMAALYDENDIIGENSDVDMDKLRGKGKGVLRIVRTNKLDDVYETNNKDTDFMADVFFYSPFGKEYDFVLRNCYIRIQGTSSTKYPSKNIRIYFNKGGEMRELTINGTINPFGSNKYQMRPGARPQNLYTLKSDYSDSSMSLNTGGAKLFNDVFKELGLLTPPQRYQYEQGGNSTNAIDVRSAIDGFPIDVFCAETEDGENEYYGQYNFNNEKSKSDNLFGMTGVDGFNPALPMTFEMLNNGERACLFKMENDAAYDAHWDDGAEWNYPEDVFWSQAALTKKGKGRLATATEKNAVKRLFDWIRSCVPSGATADDLSTFVSQKFVDEIDDYFDKDYILTYYLWTDYFLSVDQRAKNMMLRTWDGLIWYLTYYDGDTQVGKRNDCFLVYKYMTDRDTYDAQAAKYAFEGRESWLWNLVLANLGNDMKSCAQRLRAVMTTERVLKMLNEEQSGNWCDRAFNKSGYIKYIRPAVQTMYGKVWPFIYALQGSNKAHREYFIRNRFALLDAKYGTSNFTSDNVDFYLARTENDAADVVRITANEVYAFGYGTNNQQNIANTGIVQKNAVATLSVTGAYTVNDPLRMYGASQMKVLDLTGAADHLKNALDLGKCGVLRELNLQSSGNGSTGWWLNIGGCKQLRKLNLRYQKQAKTGSSTSTELDLGELTKLEDLDARGTQVQSIVVAKGAPITALRLPGTLTTLRLEYLSKLAMSGLSLEGYSNVRTFIFDNCPGLSWETLLNRCINVTNIRITGINREDDGTWLQSFMSKGGVDAEGTTTTTCALVGTVQLTSYLPEEQYNALRAHFPELNIKQPEYTIIEFDDNVSDDANVSNLDNGTGYKFGNKYEASGHVAAILKKRHRVLAKVTRKATSRNVRMGGVDTIMNNLDGEMTYFPLHDDNSNYYADAEDVTRCTQASLNGSEGDIMMYEPFFWKKGINDYLNGKHYSCYSSNSEDNMPATPDATVLSLEDIRATSGGYITGRKIMSGRDTLAASYTNDSAYSVCMVDVSGFRRVRFPTVKGTNLVGSVFVDAGGNVVNSVVVSTLGNKFENGMYVISDVPANAASLHFTILNAAEFDKVVLSNSDKIEDMEPEWSPDYEHLCAVVGSTVVGSKLMAAITGGSTTASMTWADFHYYSVSRGMQQIDALMHSRIANLFYAKHGRRDSQTQCGAGSHSNTRTTGGTMSRGMQETIGYDEAHSINSGVTNSKGDGVVNSYAWYKGLDTYGATTVTQVNNICCLGYEDIYGHKYDMMDNVDVPNDSGNVGKWRIWMPDGTTRMVQGTTNSDWWITGVAHGLHMDMTPVGSMGGSSSTYYCDKYWFSSSIGRVVHRGSTNAVAYGGVSCAHAGYAASYSSAYVGSRLAFRGRIVKAQSVAAYKALSEVA